MAGLLGDVLPSVLSAGNRARKRVGGLLSDPRNALAGLLSDAAYGMQEQMSAPALDDAIMGKRSFYDPQTMAEANKLAGALAGMIVYHGSPHRFTKFDSSKIGTGEGAQAYGHGIYTAESPEVARSYAGMSKRHKVQPDSAHVAAAQDFLSHGMDPNAGLKAAYNKITPDEIEAAVIEAKGGFSPNLYKVDLPDDAIAKMLDWDKPLSQQSPGVRDAVDKIKADLTGTFSADMTGDQLLRHVQSTLRGIGRGDVKAEEVFRQQGIPGIRYLDGGSRGSGTGTSNFVVFPGNENLLKILEVNGQGLLGR